MSDVPQIRPREVVIQAADFGLLVAWYRDQLGLRVDQLVEDGFHYCNLSNDAGIRLGIAAAAEMGVTPGDRKNNTVVLQVEVDDLRAFFDVVAAGGGTVVGPPAFNEQDGFWFGSVADPEGNPIWVVDRNCP